MTDIRTGRRFPVHLQLKVLGNQNIPVGSTENISAAGVYLWVDGELEVGAPIEFEMTIPRDTIAAGSDVHLHCTGRVVRCDPNPGGGRTGVACVIEGYEFLRTADAGGE
ncbi:MAG: PilZ domain-containing protein [Candidatus Sulfotelmatobacter sp.]